MKKKDVIFRGLCTEEQKARWEKAAKQDGRSLASWIRIVCDEAAFRQLKEPDKKKKQK